MNIFFFFFQLISQQSHPLFQVPQFPHHNRLVLHSPLKRNAVATLLLIFLYECLNDSILALYISLLPLDNFLKMHYLTTLPENHLA